MKKGQLRKSVTLVKNWFSIQKIPLLGLKVRDQCTTWRITVKENPT